MGYKRDVQVYLVAQWRREARFTYKKNTLLLSVVDDTQSFNRRNTVITMIKLKIFFYMTFPRYFCVVASSYFSSLVCVTFIIALIRRVYFFAGSRRSPKAVKISCLSPRRVNREGKTRRRDMQFSRLCFPRDDESCSLKATRDKVQSTRRSTA